MPLVCPGTIEVRIGSGLLFKGGIAYEKDSAPHYGGYLTS
jgi:hypothetical protein